MNSQRSIGGLNSESHRVSNGGSSRLKRPRVQESELQQIRLLPSTSNIPAMQSSQGVQPPHRGIGREDKYSMWEQQDIDILFDYLGSPGIYDKWKGAGMRRSGGSQQTSGWTKKKVCESISTYLATRNVLKDVDQVKNKMRHIEKKYKEAKDFLRNTGEGLTTDDAKMGETFIREKVLRLCPFFEIVDPYMTDNASNNPPYIAETGNSEDFEDLLRNDSTVRGDFEEGCVDTMPPVADVDGLPSDANLDNVPCDAHLDAQGVEYPWQDLSEAEYESEPVESVPVQPSATERGTNVQHKNQAQGNNPGQGSNSRQPPNHRPNQKKKKKDLTTALVEMQEQNRVLNEKRMVLRAQYQEGKLEFQKKQSDKEFALENRKLDLEFERIAEQREERKLREMILNLELQKLNKSN